ncbi:YSIRK-type signal peptide-containing protein, partial [Streptococcus mitis]
MENKSNSLNRIKRHQREKVLRFSIRKYSFGAASVAVAALMFLGAHAVSADVVDAKNQPAIGAANPNEEKSPLIESAPKSKNEETKETEKVEVAKETKEREKTSENKEAVEANPLNNGTSTSTITVTKDASGDKVTEKQTLDKSQLQASITKVQELLDKVNKEKAPASTLAAIQADLEKANSVLNNNSLELTQAEIDAVAKKLNEKIFVLSSMPKAITPEKVVKEGKNTIANTGSHDSRNGQRMGEGVSFRANDVRVEGALYNVKEYISEPSGHGSTAVGQRTRTIDKTFMTARYSKENGMKFITYDVYFQNDGKALDGYYRNAFWFYPPRDLLPDVGRNYPIGVVSEAYYERYRKKAGATGILSDNPDNFTREGERYTVPLGRLASNSYQDSDSQRLWGAAGGLFQMSGGPNSNDQRQQMLKQLQYNEDLNRIIKLKNDPNGSYPGGSYSHLLTVGIQQDFAYKYHVKMRLRDDVTDAQAQRAGAMAVTAKEGFAKTALAAYVYAATGTKLESKPDAQLNPIQGLTVTKTVGDTLGNPDDPANSGYVTHKESKPFPAGMTWSWEKGVKPASTATTAGVFKYKVIARYQDGTSSENPGSGSDGTVTLNVKPKTPVIDQNSVNEKAGKKGQNVVVDVKEGVPDGSTVTLYSGDEVIGTGITRGQKATINVSRALPSTAIKAKTTVKNTTVDSEFSAPVIPTPERDTQPPTVKIVYKTSNNAETTLTDDISKAPTIDVYRGANIELPLKYYDNNAAGKVNIQHVSGIPKGVWFNKNASEHSNVTIQESGKTENAQGSYTVRGRVDANAPLGISIVKLKVSDAADGNVNQGNHKEVKFRVRVLDLDFEQGVSAQTGVAKISREVELNRPVGDANNYLTVNDGSQRSDRLFPSGMTFRFIRGTEYKTNLTYTDPGKYTVKAAAFYPTTYVPTNGESVTATNATGDNVNEIRGRAYIARDIEFRVKPTAPTVTPQENGDVTVTPVNEKNVNSFNFTYNDPNNSSRKITATKTKDGWTLNNAPDDGVTIDKTTGKVTIKDRAIKDSAPITAKSETSDHVESNPATVNSKAGEKEPPKFAFDEKNTTVENGFRTVYVTPTESNNFRLGTVTDNSKKLIESRLSSKDNNTNDLDYGLSYEGKLLKTNNGPELTAPKDIMVTGTLDKTNKSDHGNKWTNGKEIVTRYYVATDAAGNELRNQDNVASNPTRVVFKVLTQAEKYVPKVGTQQLDKDVTGKGAKLSDAEFNAMKPKLDLNFTATRGEVKINGKTKDLELTMKDRGEIKKKPDGTYYIGATIKYPDLSTEDIEIPISKSDTSAPTATMDGLTLTNDINTTAKFVVFKGATFNPTIRVSDDKSNVTNLSVSGISNGTKIEKSGNWSKDGTDVKVELGNATATNTATLGDHEGSVVVKDALNNTNTYKFKYTVVDVEVKETPKTVPLNTQLGDSHYNVKVVDTPNADGNDKYYPTGMSFKWKKGNSEVANETELAKPGVITDYKALVKFPNGGGVRKSIDGKEVRIYAPATVERPVTFHVKPVAPTISQWQNGNVKVTPPTDGDKVTIPLTDGTVTLVKKDSGWELETPKAGLVFHNGSLEIPKKLVGTSVTAKATKGTGGSAVDSDNTTYTPKSHTVTKVDIVKEAGSPLSRDDLSGKTGVTGLVDGTETKDFAATKIRSVVEKTSPLPNVTPDSKQTIPVTITYEDGSTETTDVIVKVKPQAPTVTPKENGTVEITPILTGEGTTTITYTGEDNTSKTVTVTKAGDGTWTSSDPTIAVDANGKVTIPADKVKDGSPITAQVTSKLTGLPSQPAKATVGKPLEVAFGKPENAREKAKYTSKVVVTPNKSNSTITAPTVNGLTVNSEGKVTGTPDIKDWDRIEEHRDVTIKVTVTHEGDTPVTKDVIVNVLRDTDGDGDPDITDKDDDNDGIPDEEEKKNGTDPKAPTTQTPTIGITRKENGDAIVTPTKPGGGTYPSGTKVVIPGDNNTTIEVEIGNDGSGTVPNDKLPKGEVSGKGIVKEPNKEPSKPVNVTTPARKPSTIELEQDPKTGDVSVTPKKPDGTLYPENTKVEIPGKDKDHPIIITIGKDGTGKVSNNDLPEGKTPGIGKITEKGKTPEEVKVETPKRIDPTLPETEAPTDIAITRKENGDAIVTPKKPGGGIYPQGTKVEIPGEDGKTIEVTIGKDGSGEVPNDKLPKEAKPGRGTVTEPNKKPSRPVSVTTPARKTPTVELQQDPDTGEVTVTPKKPDGTLYPENTKVEIPGKNGTPIVVIIGAGGKGKVPNKDLPDGKISGTGTITEPGTGKTPEKVTVETPARLTPALVLDQDPNTGDVTVTPKKPDGTLYPENTKVEIPGKDKDHPITITIGKDGKGKVPNSELPEGKVPGTSKITVPGKPSVEVPNVTTPSKLIPTVELDQDPDTGEVTVTPKKPDGKLYPENTKVEIPGKDKDHPITITIGKDGKGKVPNNELPEGKVPGTSKITVPGKPSVEVPNVTTPSKLIPTVELQQDPDTGEVTVTPKKPDGTLYPENTKVEIPGKDKDHPITITIGKDGKGKVPNSELPEEKVPGTSKITVPGKPSVEVPKVTTPAKVTPETPVTEKPGKIEITQQPNGNAIVTPKKPDGTTYPSGSKVEIPGENGTTITVTIGNDGSGTVPNDKLPKDAKPGTGTVTEPNKKPSQPVDVITPSRKTPTLDVERDPKTGDVTVTPQRPGGGTYPPGTTVEIPGEDGPITVEIGQDGKGKVPNDKLPKKAVPGTGKITEPNKPSVEVPNVTTPAKVTPETPVTEKPGKIEITQQPNGNAIVTPKKPDGTTYPSGSKVEIPG